MCGAKKDVKDVKREGHSVAVHTAKLVATPWPGSESKTPLASRKSWKEDVLRIQH